MFNRELANIEKQKFQEEVANLSSKYNMLIVEAATGTGKSRSAFLSIERSNSRKKWLILVPEITLISNILQDLEKHDIDIRDKIEDVICYASLKKYEGAELNILMDEGHRGTSDNRLDYLESIKFDQIIVLSATLNRSIKDRLLRLGNWHEYKLSLEEAISRGMLPKPDIRIVYKELGDSVKDYPYKFGKKQINLTAKEYYNQLSKTIDYWKEKWESEQKSWQYNKFLLSATNRKRWLAEYKTESAKEVLKSVENKRFICFCGSVAQAKKLGGTQAIHSKNSKEQNQKIIDAFNYGESSSIFACGMLREGQNLSDIESSVLVQLDSDIRAGVQMVGRSMRSDNPIIYILCVKGTQDEKYLNKFINEIDKKYVTYV